MSETDRLDLEGCINLLKTIADDLEYIRKEPERKAQEKKLKEISERRQKDPLWRYKLGPLDKGMV